VLANGEDFISEDSFCDEKKRNKKAQKKEIKKEDKDKKE